MDDLGAIAAKVFADSQTYIGQELKLGSDLQSINEVHALYKQVVGKEPPHFPMPEFIFRLFTGDDLLIMWKYLSTANLGVTPEATLAILPEGQTVRTGLIQQNQKGLLR